VTKEEFYEALVIATETIKNGIKLTIEAAKEFWDKLKESFADFLQLPEIQENRQSWYRQQFSKVFMAHKKGNSLYLRHQVISRKPRQCFARNSI
jgi:hypothetical protein